MLGAVSTWSLGRFQPVLNRASWRGIKGGYGREEGERGFGVYGWEKLARELCRRNQKSFPVCEVPHVYLIYNQSRNAGPLVAEPNQKSGILNPEPP